YFWELTSSEIGIVVLPAYVAAMLAGVVAAASSRTLGKKWASIAVSLAAIVVVPLPVVLRLAGWFPANRTPAVLPLLMLCNLIGITLLIASNILFSSMVADVAEDSEVATGRRSEGVFTAATLFVQKATTGIGIFASSLLLGAIGFPQHAAPGAVAPEGVRTFGLV